jgi:teichuronic acid biosynthesis glycosyltransferase TuaG
MKGDLVSVIMPAYNAVDTIEKAMSCVLEQTYRNLELLVIDDCSSDATLELVTNLQNTDTRIKFYRNENNSGAGYTRNIGIKNAQGTYIAFLDADDEWKPSKLQTQVNYISETGCNIVCSWYDIFDRQSGTIRKRKAPAIINFQTLIKENIVGCLTVMYSTKTLGKKYMPTIRKRQDYALWLELTKSGENIHCIQDSLAIYNTQAGSISHNKFEMLIFNYRMYRKNLRYSIIMSIFYTLQNTFYKVRSILGNHF